MTAPGTDYTVRQTTAGPGGLVTYRVVDRSGVLVNVAVAYRHSTPELADPVIRAALAARFPARKPL